MQPAQQAYLDLSDDEQVEALRPVLAQAANRFGLDVVASTLVTHEYNTTFAVDDADGRRFALRVCTNSFSTPANIVAQQEWQRAILAGGEVTVADPLQTRDGGWFAEVDCAVFGRPLLVTAASWLDGPDAGDDLPDEVAHALGRAMALLHRQAQTWSLPPGGDLPRRDRPLFGDPDRLSDAPVVADDQLEVLATTTELSTAVFARLHDGAALRAVHADLHGGNLKWAGGRLAVFDFDDCGLGLPVLDLAIATFYLRDGDPAAEAALRAGYEQVAPLPDGDPCEPGDLDALMAARQLLLANSLFASSTAEQRAEAVDYLGVTLARLRHWLEGGTFTRALPP